MRKLLIVTAAAGLLGTVCGILFPWGEGAAHGQSSKKGAKSKKPIANVQNLDLRATQMQTSFVKEAEDLAGQYADAGHLEKAKGLLESVLALSPDAPGVKDKLKKVDELILTSNDFQMQVNAAGGWEETKAMLFKDQPVRFQVTGTYRFVANTMVGAAGFPNKDPEKDMATDVPCGALMGVIVAEGNKPGKQFLIGEGVDFKPKETGYLFLRVNSPPDCKHVGKLSISISGYVKSK